MERGYSVKETAKLLGVQMTTVRHWIRIGTIFATKIAGTRRWVVAESEIKRLRGYGD